MKLLILFFFIVLLFGNFSYGAVNPKKVALVIGNQSYSAHTKLKNPINDAKLIKKTLESLDFTVFEVHDADTEMFDKKLSSFVTEVRKADVAVFFYAGHGIGVEGENYAIPINTHNLSKENLPRKLISLKELQKTVAKASKFGVVFFDACRNSFFTQNIEGLENSRGSRDLVRPTVRNSKNILVSFSTQAGTLAKDDVDGSKHSPYATALSEKLKLKKDIRLVMGSVKDRVQELTKNSQIPIDRSSLGGDEYYLSANNKNSVSTGVIPVFKNDTQTSNSRKYTTTINDLMWQDEPFTLGEAEAYVKNENLGKVRQWKKAKEYCHNLTLNGFDDWKLPTLKELKNLYKSKGKLRHHTPRYPFWSSATVSSKLEAKTVNFKNGSVGIQFQTNYSNVRCVRLVRIKAVNLKKENKKQKFTLEVKTTPSDARVRIMNIKPKYYENIKLAPGKYDILVSKNGYVSERFYITVDENILLNFRT